MSRRTKDILAGLVLGVVLGVALLAIAIATRPTEPNPSEQEVGQLLSP